MGTSRIQGQSVSKIPNKFQEKSRNYQRRPLVPALERQGGGSLSLRPAWVTLRPPSPKQTRNYKQKFVERSGASRKRAGGQRPGLGLGGPRTRTRPPDTFPRGGEGAHPQTHARARTRPRTGSAKEHPSGTRRAGTHWRTGSGKGQRAGPLPVSAAHRGSACTRGGGARPPEVR